MGVLLDKVTGIVLQLGGLCQLAGIFNLDLQQGDLFFSFGLFNGLTNAHTVDHAAENHVLAIQPVSFCESYEKLT
jgi:hypothetical protein